MTSAPEARDPEASVTPTGVLLHACAGETLTGFEGVKLGFAVATEKNLTVDGVTGARSLSSLCGMPGDE